MKLSFSFWLSYNIIIHWFSGNSIGFLSLISKTPSINYAPGFKYWLRNSSLFNVSNWSNKPLSVKENVKSKLIQTISLHNSLLKGIVFGQHTQNKPVLIETPNKSSLFMFFLLSNSKTTVKGFLTNILNTNFPTYLYIYYL